VLPTIGAADSQRAKLGKAHGKPMESQCLVEQDKALEQNPNDKELIQLRDLLDVLFGSRTYYQPSKDSPKENEGQVKEHECTPKKDATKNWDFNQTDEAYPYTQVSKFDLNLTKPPTTKGFKTPKTLRGVRAVADVSGNADIIMSKRSTLTPYNICDAQADILFMTDSVNEPRGKLETLCPGIKISSGVIDIFTKVQNHAKLYHDPLKPMHKVFFETSMMHERDVKDSSAKEDDVKEAAKKFNENMLRILRTTSYRNLSNVDLVVVPIYVLVFFPMIQGSHFFVVCMHLIWKEVHILDNTSSLITDVSARYGDVVEYLVRGEVCRFPRIPKPSSTRSNEDCCMHDPKVGVYDKENFIDRGIFAMCHMETYMGGGEYDDLCRLRRECKAQKLQLDELRMKYATKILLWEINQKKSDFEVKAEAYM
ncbi:ulp1 protease family, C-terminal catalytic domain-containing protein, partial [Tanacetum coccineum]